jgi:hypothetical protein
MKVGPVVAAFERFARTEYDHVFSGAVSAMLDKMTAANVKTVRLPDRFVSAHVYGPYKEPVVDQSLADRTTLAEWISPDDGMPQAALLEPVESGLFAGGAISVTLLAAPADNALVQPCRVLLDLRAAAAPSLSRLDQLRVDAGLAPAKHARLSQLVQMDLHSVFLPGHALFMRAEPNDRKPAVHNHSVEDEDWSWGPDGLEFALMNTAVHRGPANEPMLSPALPAEIREAALVAGRQTLRRGPRSVLRLASMLTTLRRLH